MEHFIKTLGNEEEPGAGMKDKINKINKIKFVLSAGGGTWRDAIGLHFHFQKSRQLFRNRTAQKIATGEGGQILTHTGE